MPWKQNNFFHIYIDLYLWKLNKRISSQEIEYDGPNGIVGYYDIKDSDYVIVHRLDYTFSSKSPENVYEYELRVNVGL